MDYILNVFEKANKIKGPGVVDIVNVYDFRYFNLYIDGVLIDTVRKEEPWKTVLKRSFIKQCVNASGVGEEKLLFVLTDLYDLGEDACSDEYDANDYDDYTHIIELFKKFPNLKGKYRPYSSVFAVGISDLERQV